MYAQDNNSLPVWIILSPAHHHISTNSQPFLVGIVSCSPKAMQFGCALEWVLRKVATADPTQSPLYLLKIDLSDGFYHVHLHVQDAPLLGVAFPMAPGELLLMAILLVLPMGWTESPPYFCTTTERIVDLANLY